MKLSRQTIYIVIAAAVLIASIAGMDAFRRYRENRLASAVSNASAAANESEKRAKALEIEAAAHREKIGYLETQLAEINKIARRQDEEIKLYTLRSNAARADVERARRIGAIETTVDELCSKLGELGHGCR